MAETQRLPHFLIIGAPKSGTTTLYRWLSEQPEIFMPPKDALYFFIRPRGWRRVVWIRRRLRGPRWYSRQFSEASDGQILGEASAGYVMAGTAERIAKLLPHVRLICVLREPTQRLRSHYRQRVQRGFQFRRPRSAAGRFPFLDFSLYAERLKPFFELFPRENLCIVRFEDLYSHDETAWRKILEHIGLTPRPRPTGAYNVSAEKAYLVRTTARLQRTGLLDLRRLPDPIKAVVKATLRKPTAWHMRRVASSYDPLPPPVLRRIEDDMDELERLLGWPTPIWPLDHPWRVSPREHTNSFGYVKPTSNDPPTVTYLICTTPRTGSWYLSEALLATRMAGQPAEFFWHAAIGFWQQCLQIAPSSYVEYVNQVMRTTATKNRIFGAKIMDGYLDQFLRQMEIDARRRLTLEEIFPNLHCVFLTRRDRAGQAVSWWRAQQTGQWVSGLEAVVEPHYDFAGIDRCYNSIAEGERRWTELFRRAEMPALEVEYEEVVNDPRQAVSRILDHIGVSTTIGLEFRLPELNRQADEHSQTWKTRYLQEKGVEAESPQRYVPQDLKS